MEAFLNGAKVASVARLPDDMLALERAAQGAREVANAQGCAESDHWFRGTPSNSSKSFAAARRFPRFLGTGRFEGSPRSSPTPGEKIPKKLVPEHSR